MKITIGKRIKELRTKVGMTREQLANEVGVTYQAVSKWENEISAPDIQSLSIIAEILGVTIDELLNGKEENNEDEKNNNNEKQQEKRPYFGLIPGVVNKDIHGDVGK